MTRTRAVLGWAALLVTNAMKAVGGRRGARVVFLQTRDRCVPKTLINIRPALEVNGDL